MAYSGSSRTLGSPCMNAFSPSAKVPSDVVDARICSVMLMDDSSGVGQLRSISWMSGSLRPCTHHLALALYPVSVSFQRRTRREEITLSLCFSLITSACVESMMVTALKSSFRLVSLLFGRKAFPGYLVGVPSTEVLGRRRLYSLAFCTFIVLSPLVGIHRTCRSRCIVILYSPVGPSSVMLR